MYPLHLTHPILLMRCIFIIFYIFFLSTPHPCSVPDLSLGCSVFPSELEQAVRATPSPRPRAEEAEPQARQGERAGGGVAETLRRDASLHVEDLDEQPLSPIPDSHSSMDKSVDSPQLPVVCLHACLSLCVPLLVGVYRPSAPLINCQ